MDYKEEDAEDKKYKKGAKFGRKEFKKDVAEAVVAAQPKAKPKKKGRSSYASWSAAKLRTFIKEKRKALLVKSGFPDGGIPRTKEAMILLCNKLKRKRW
jgi:hypothetical protein